jgi:oligopeptide transport system ATP-binding protein
VTAAVGTPEPLIRVQNLKKHFPITAGVFRRQVGTVKAVDGISFDLLPKETLGLVGESGCGKTTAGRTVLNLYTPTEGKVYFGQTEVTALGVNDLRTMRQKMQMIFQDPQDSLNPRMTVGSIISEPLLEHTKVSGLQRTERVEELLQAVGLNAKYMNRYPHEFSGGQRQRIGVARALALNPEFIICDEPIAALDVSIQAQVVNLLEDLQEKFGLTYLFISHDLGMIRHIARRVAVMYLGHIVEIATSQNLYSRPQHPYTQALLSAVPTHDPVREETRERIILTGDVPSPADPPSGCPFRTRCPSAESKCAEEVPELRQIETGHRVACHLVA